MDISDTIVAVASAAGGAATGIIRLSGPSTLSALAQLVSSNEAEQVRTCSRSCRMALKLSLFDDAHQGQAGTVNVQAYLWPTSRSYTRQPSAELHLIGSPPLLDQLLSQLLRCGVRLALPGEFTLRAFLAGRLDLTQAEAVLGVIDAHSQAELSTALSQLAGGLTGPLAQVRGDLLDLLADLEAGLDFVDEDISFVSAEDARARLLQAQSQVKQLLASLQNRALSGEAPAVVLLGRPNVGKSSLFNRLVNRQAAIVSTQAGTTRDYLSAEVEWAGQPLRLIDTAGLDPQTALSEIDLRAQNASAEQQSKGAITLVCIDSTREPDAWEQQQLRHPTKEQLVVLTKSDRPTHPSLQGFLAGNDFLLTSSEAGEGVTALQNKVRQALAQIAAGEILPATAQRCQESLQGADQALQHAIALQQAGQGDELVAAEIRLTLDELGKILGVIYTDDLLDRVFSRFCIGK